MRKYLMGCLAIVLAIALSSFHIKSSSHGAVDLYWFQIAGQYGANAPVVSGDAVFIQSSPLPPAGVGCGASSYQCVSGFAFSDVVASGSGYILNGNGQQPEQEPYKKN
jgi:hypothetical protein